MLITREVVETKTDHIQRARQRANISDVACRLKTVELDWRLIGVYQPLSFIYLWIFGLTRTYRSTSQPIGLRCNEAYCAPFISAKCQFKGILFSQIHSTRPRLSGIKVKQAISSKLSRQSLDKFIVNNEKFNSYSGTDVTKFLQGVCTNDVNKLKNHGDCIAAAFLTPKVKLGLIVGRKFRTGTPFL